MGGWCFDIVSSSHRDKEFRFRVRQAGSTGHFYKPNGSLESSIVATGEVQALDLFLSTFNLNQAYEIMVGRCDTGEVRLFRVEPPVPSKPRITRI